MTSKLKEQLMAFIQQQYDIYLPEPLPERIVEALIAIICSQREALEFVYKKSDPFMPCEDDWDASDPLHCVVMNSMDALADTDARLKSMGVL